MTKNILSFNLQNLVETVSGLKNAVLESDWLKLKHFFPFCSKLTIIIGVSGTNL